MTNYNMKGESCTMSYYITNKEETKEIKLTEVMRNSGSISVNKDLIRFMDEGRGTGLMRATVLTEIISKYEMWKDKGDLQKDGSFFYTADEIENDTGVSPYIQKTNVFPYLEKLGLLKRELRRHPDNPMKQVRFIKLDVKACIKLFEEVIPKFKEKAEKARHDAMGENLPSERLKINHPNGRKSTGSNTELNNTELNNTEYTPLTPQKRKNEQQEHKQENEERPKEKGGNPINQFIKDNFDEDIGAMLQSVYYNLDKPKEFNLYFLKEFKKAYSKIKEDKKDSRIIRSRMIKLLIDLREGLEVERSLAGLMIYRFNKDENNVPANKEVMANRFEQSKRESHKKNKQTSYETDHSKYDFSKRRLLSADDLVKIEESY